MRQFITNMLNIQEDKIEELQTIAQSDGSIIINLKLKVTSKICPFCSGPVKIHGYYPRTLTHSTLVNRKCSIVYRQRRFRCPKCSYSFNELNPFTKANDGLTHETKINILKDLKHPEDTYTSVAERYHVSKATVLRLFDKHVDIMRKPLPMVLSMDEHYFPESDMDSLYCCLLMNFITGEVIDVLPTRRKHYLIDYFASIRGDIQNYTLKRSELNNVKYISMDLYDNFRDVAQICFPDAIVCADSFHVTKHLTDDFNKIRLRWARNTENHTYEYLLRKFNFVFNHTTDLDNEPKYNKALGRYVNLRDIRDLLFAQFPELEIAYNLKELYLKFNQSGEYYKASGSLEENYDILKNRFGDFGIPEYNEFYGLLVNWKQEILNSFTTINGRRINNSYSESKNRILKKLIINANGFRNFKRTRNRILYCLNKYDKFTL